MKTHLVALTITLGVIALVGGFIALCVILPGVWGFLMVVVVPGSGLMYALVYSEVRERRDHALMSEVYKRWDKR